MQEVTSSPQDPPRPSRQLSKPAQALAGSTGVAAVSYTVWDLLRAVPYHWVPYIAAAAILIALATALFFYLNRASPRAPTAISRPEPEPPFPDPIGALTDSIAERRRLAVVMFIFATLASAVVMGLLVLNTLSHNRSDNSLVFLAGITIASVLAMFFMLEYKMLRHHLHRLDEQRAKLSMLLALLRDADDSDPHRREVLEQILMLTRPNPDVTHPRRA